MDPCIPWIYGVCSATLSRFSSALNHLTMQSVASAFAWAWAKMAKGIYEVGAAISSTPSCPCHFAHSNSVCALEKLLSNRNLSEVKFYKDNVRAISIGKWRFGWHLLILRCFWRDQKAVEKKIVATWTLEYHYLKKKLDFFLFALMKRGVVFWPTINLSSTHKSSVTHNEVQKNTIKLKK